VVPSASAGSLPFLPQPVMRVLQNIKNHYGAAWSRYGFVNAFNPLKNWYDTDVIGIDTGITMVMAENARTGFVWETFMKNPEAKRGMERAGFQTYVHPATETTG
ncbi:MAG: glucoamylase family protein, partial [Terriglobales bacterium]